MQVRKVAIFSGSRPATAPTFRLRSLAEQLFFGNDRRALRYRSPVEIGATVIAAHCPVAKRRPGRRRVAQSLRRRQQIGRSCVTCRLRGDERDLKVAQKFASSRAGLLPRGREVAEEVVCRNSDAATVASMDRFPGKLDTSKLLESMCAPATE
jgi:hypothetical protein